MPIGDPGYTLTDALTDLLPAGCRRDMLGFRGGALGCDLPLCPRMHGPGASGGSVVEGGVHHLQVFAPEQLQLQHAGQRRPEALADADALAAGPERVYAAAAAGHPRQRAHRRNRCALLIAAQIPWNERVRVQVEVVQHSTGPATAT
ncbi:hypothetical protein Q8A73_010891 [Channa argus]|nr:hypothetical protein Q8A73_010891 [Channa argus]